MLLNMEKQKDRVTTVNKYWGLRKNRSTNLSINMDSLSHFEIFNLRTLSTENKKKMVHVLFLTV